MMPTLSGIRELLNVMRSDVFFHNTHADISTQSGIQYDHENDLVNPNSCETVIPTSESYHGLPVESTSQTAMSPQKPTYTVLTSKTKLTSTKPAPDPINPDTYHGSSLSTISKVQKTIPRPANTVLPNTFTDPNMLTMNRKSCNPDGSTTFQNILPKPVYTVIISNTAKPESNTAYPTLYQLQKPNISATCSPKTSTVEPPKSLHVVPVLNHNAKLAIPKLQPTTYVQFYPVLNSNNASSVTKTSSSLPVYGVSTSNTEISRTNCVIERQDCSSQPELKTLYPVSTLKSSSRDALRSIIQQSSCQSGTRVSSAKSSESSSFSKFTGLKPKKTRIVRKSRSKQVNICVQKTGQCDGNLSDVKVELSREELWKLFHEEGNEMIVSKHGRPMFPTLDLKVSGLCPDEMYSVAVKFVCVDKYRYYFDTSRETWDQTRETLAADHSKCFEHPESPATGKVWNEKQLKFSELRLINRSTNLKNMVFTPTMRKHCVQVVITMLRCSRCHTEHTRHINIPLTEFIAVSSYYSLKISQLKIAHNPLAKMGVLTTPRKRKNRKRKSTENSFNEDTPISSSESTLVTIPNNETSSITTSTEVSTVPDLTTSSNQRNASSSQPSTISPPYVLHSITPSTSTSQLPIIAGQALEATVSTSATKPTTALSTIKPPENRNMLSQTRASSEYSNNVLSCQTAKAKTLIQSDEDILEYIKTYLSPFQTSEEDEAFDSSILDELSGINSITDKLNGFDDLNFVLTNIAEC